MALHVALLVLGLWWWALPVLLVLVPALVALDRSGRDGGSYGSADPAGDGGASESSEEVRPVPRALVVFESMFGNT